MRRWFAALLGLALALPALAAGDRTGWDKQSDRIVDGPDARIAIRSGDIDNLGFGWDADFDPFSGRSTLPHSYPWTPKDGDAAGTDRIMVGTAYDPKAIPACVSGSDGYAAGTQRPGNLPQAMTLELGDLGDPPKAILVQMFIDDFQTPRWGSKFQVTLNGERLLLFEQALAKVDQTGPIGKLISVKLFPEQFRLLESGTAKFLIDDPETAACDGYAVDFVRILIDPKPAAYPVALEGIAVDKETQEPIEGAIVQAALGDAETAKDGTFRIEALPAGLVTAQASHPDYEPDMQLADVEAGQTGEVRFELKRRKAESGSLGETLDDTGRVVIPGIYFDTAKAVLRPDSETALQAVLGIMTERPKLAFVVEGHTDNQGDDAYNLKLSQDRAAAVVAWLVDHGIEANRLLPQGYGEERPVADNDSDTGRQLNRRVEIAIQK